MEKHLPGREKPGKACLDKDNSYIASSGLYNFSSSLSKREGVYIHTRSPRLAGGSPAIGDLEYETWMINCLDREEEINGMGSVDSTLVRNSNKNLEVYKSWVGDWIAR